MAIDRKVISLVEFERFIALPENHERRFELINGEIVEKVPTEKHGAIASIIVIALGIYLQAHKIGRVIIEGRYRSPVDGENDRIPDVSFTLGLERPLVESGPVMGMPDLAVEIKSPDDTFKEMRDKANYYLEHGSRLVWLIFPEKKIVEVWSKDAQEVLNVEDTLTGGDVLPGFSLAVREIFDV